VSIVPLGTYKPDEEVNDDSFDDVPHGFQDAGEVERDDQYREQNDEEVAGRDDREGNDIQGERQGEEPEMDYSTRTEGEYMDDDHYRELVSHYPLFFHHPSFLGAHIDYFLAQTEQFPETTRTQIPSATTGSAPHVRRKSVIPLDAAILRELASHKRYVSSLEDTLD
jgi:hypothetical protein